MFYKIMTSKYTTLVIPMVAVVFPWFYPVVVPLLEFQQMQ
jgi:hypothetical protein